MMANAGATFDPKSRSWLAMLILKELDEVVQWCIDYYSVQLDSHTMVSTVIYSAINSVLKDYSKRSRERQCHTRFLKLVDDSVQSLTNEQQIELEAKYAKEAEFYGSLTAAKGARLLVEKWRVSKKTILISDNPSPKEIVPGSVELLKLMWSYYHDIRSEHQELDAHMSRKLQLMLHQAVANDHTECVECLLGLTTDDNSPIRLDATSCLRNAAKEGALSTIEFLLKNTNLKVTKEVFNTIFETGHLPTVESAISNYSEFASESSILATIRARNKACYKLSTKSIISTVPERLHLSQEIYAWQRILEQLETILGKTRPPRGYLGGSSKSQQEVVAGFRMAYHILQQPPPEEYQDWVSYFIPSSSSPPSKCCVC